MLPVGEKRYVSGTAQLFDGTLQIVHPDRVVHEDGLAKLPSIDTVYPLTEGLAIGSMRRAMVQALQKAAEPSGVDQSGGHTPLQLSFIRAGSPPRS